MDGNETSQAGGGGNPVGVPFPFLVMKQKNTKYPTGKGEGQERLSVMQVTSGGYVLSTIS